jgi:hypothetical protein
VEVNAVARETSTHQALLGKPFFSITKSAPRPLRGLRRVPVAVQVIFEP